MLTEKNLSDMIEIVTTAIEIHAREEDFFRRSSTASRNEAAKALLSEIAEDLCRYREKLETRRRELQDQLTAMRASHLELKTKQQ